MYRTHSKQAFSVAQRFAARYAHTARSIVFSETGNPKECLKVVSHEIPDPEPNQVVLKLVGAPINPADLNQVEGVYPSKPRVRKDLVKSLDVSIGGNEGCFEVIEAGAEAGLKVGDWVVPRIASFGTWTTHALAQTDELIPLGASKGLTPLQAATISVNPGTAYRMLEDFANMEPGEYFIQNGGNSGVGRMAIQLGKLWGLKSISVVRDRRDIDQLKAELQELGADYVVTEEQINDKSIKHIIKDWTHGQGIKLGLNCVGGRSATNIARQLGQNAHLVTYGGMSKQPVSLPTSLYIFKNLASHGFWLTRWNKEHTHEREKMLKEIADLFRNNEIRESHVSGVELDFAASDIDLWKQFESALDGSGKQVLLGKDSN